MTVAGGEGDLSGVCGGFAVAVGHGLAGRGGGGFATPTKGSCFVGCVLELFVMDFTMGVKRGQC